MSSQKHTPGPWRLGKRSDDVVADTEAGHPYDADSMDFYGGHLVAESIAQRNRSLIAAAPDLLAALREIVKADDDQALTQEHISAARAAIAKATGAAA